MCQTRCKGERLSGALLGLYAMFALDKYLPNEARPEYSGGAPRNEVSEAHL